MATPFPFVAGSVLEASELNAITELPINAKTASHTLVAADAGARVQMTNAGATTITVNASVFTAGQSVYIYNLGAGTCTITAGTATVTTSGSLALAQYGGGTLLFTSASAATFFSGGGVGYGTATGGTGVTSTTVGGINYAYTSFTSTGTLTVTKSGLFDVLIFGGGGASAGRPLAFGFPGAGSGGISRQTIYLDANTTVTVGAGGSTYSPTTLERFGMGSSSQIGVMPTAIAAFGGTSGFTTTTGVGFLFTGGGFGSWDGQANDGVSTIQGYKGGTSSGATNAGGGGGTTAVGGNGSSTTGGAGGTGFDVSAFIGGSALGKGAGGGGGASVTGGAAASGGVAGSTGAGTAAAANSGSGAGGGYNSSTGANGGSGIVYVRWKV